MMRVLDSGAMLCLLNNEQGADRVEELIQGTEPVLMHAVNMVELQYLLLRSRGEGGWRTALGRIHAARIQIVRDMDDNLLATAARLKAFNAPIALGDIFGVALAVQRSATFVTTDRGELQKLADVGICSIEFLR